MALHLDQTFSGYSVDDVGRARAFYRDVLGFDVADTQMGGLDLPIGSGGHVFLYPKPDHQPATYTVLNIPVDDIDAAVAELRGRGVTLERYVGLTGEDGIARGKAAGRGPDIAWFRDPAGNILSVLQN
jgi:catechol 2,3-dioxygenase-like lactoylglutathione lyase family enzyme